MSDNTDTWNRLAAEFPRDQISWRAQSLTKDGSKAMALAYVTARDVMERLDEAVGPGNWSNRFDSHGDTTICYLSIKVGDEWITKADGAGNTDVEAEKGRLSDALKRSAVLWGVARYLYEMPSPWVACDVWTDASGKMRWQKWKEDPWEHVKTAPKVASAPVVPLATSAAQGHWTVIASALSLCTTEKQLIGEFDRHRQVFDLLPDHFQQDMREHYRLIRDSIKNPPKAASPNFDKLQTNDISLTQEQKLAATP